MRCPSAPRVTAELVRPPKAKEPLPGHPSNFDSTLGHAKDDQWIVDKVLDRRLGPVDLEYLLSWQDWSDHWDEWVLRDNIDSSMTAAFDAEHPLSAEEAAMVAAQLAAPPQPSRSAVKATATSC